MCGVALAADLRNRPSHDLISRGLGALARLTHRGGAGSGVSSADGAGILVQIPWNVFGEDLPRAFTLGGPPNGPPKGGPHVRGGGGPHVHAAGMFFFPRGAAPELMPLVRESLEAFGWTAVHWRPVPVDRNALHAHVAPEAPDVFQVFARARSVRVDDERGLYRARQRIEQRIAQLGIANASVVSLSTRTIVYKGLVAPDALARFYPDLDDPRFESALAIVHERFSTNTSPRWDLAQPFRVLAHNGEINTVLGNRLWMRARQRDASSLPGAWRAAHGPAVRDTGSDSQSLDDAVEVLRHAGYSLPHALMRLVPPAWEHDATLSAEEIAFHRFQACLSEPWDGPAAIAFSDGRLVGAGLDRNGFRPARLLRTADHQLFVGSEAGIFDVSERDITHRGRLGPGQMVVADLEAGTVMEPPEVRRRLARQRPYRAWLDSRVLPLAAVPQRSTSAREPAPSEADLRRLQRLFDYTHEELELIIRPMVAEAKEAVGSMGDDTPLAVLSRRSRLLPDYFRQRFAQVTNPPMDPLRERSMMSLQTLLGRRGNVLDEACLDDADADADVGAAALLAVPSPVLSEAQFNAICQQAGLKTRPPAGMVAPAAAASPFPSAIVPTLFPVRDRESGFEHALQRVVAAASQAIERGALIVVLSDRDADAEMAPLPPLLATSAVHHGLIENGLRLRASLVVETGEARDAHQTATLLACGAEAVFPYLAYATAARLGASGDRGVAVDRYRRALEDGLLKIFSKMGVSTASGYCGGQLFEILGLDATIAGRYFPHTPCQLGGETLEDVARHALERHRRVFSGDRLQLEHRGVHVFRRDGEYHANNPALVRQLHRAASSGSAEAYALFTELVRQRPPTALRDLLEFVPAAPAPLDEVEPADAICRRFFGSGMSVGALGPEVHRTIAIAMNQLGARSNSGEGGEEPERFARRDGQPWSNCATKQVASARFGVTPEYLVSASELQIKIAQGSKPGEGGQLPAIKVVPHIARLRHAQPATTLISPPPHHDIYSIEDLAQLVYDLKAIHPRARINVKLVAQAGVGIVAAGVVKAGADAIQISGHDGGTGASPRGSIKHAGSPWELGLAETQRVLTLNGLRHRVVLQTDGGLKTGRDIAIAAALGADEFGFGTAMLVAVGCVMARQCHLNTCPVGIATQREDLRARFSGTPEMIMTYLRLLADEVRTILARLGLRSLQELVGRADLLQRRPTRAPAAGDMSGAGADVDKVDVSRLLVRADADKDDRVADKGVRPLCRDTAGKKGSDPFFSPGRRDAVVIELQRTPPGVQPPTANLNEAIAATARDMLGQRPICLHACVANTDRAVGTRLAGLIASRFGDAGVPEHPVTLVLSGSAGQSFGAFSLPGMHLVLTGEANDYVGKGMHGGQIVIRSPAESDREEVDVLVGNTALYGATGGRVFIAGAAGERFAVRNSGASAVVEGVGDHACEYMTGGLVLVLGRTGRNFAAGMTGGLAFVLDVEHGLATRCNHELVEVTPLGASDEPVLRALLVEHRDLTGSRRAARALTDWRRACASFRKVVPKTEQLAEQAPAERVMAKAV